MPRTASLVATSLSSGKVLVSQRQPRFGQPDGPPGALAVLSQPFSVHCQQLAGRGVLLGF